MKITIVEHNLEEIYAKFDAQEKPKDFEESGIYISDVIELYAVACSSLSLLLSYLSLISF